MKQILAKRQAVLRRKLRTRAKIVGSARRPRFVVSITNRHVIAQMIDDVNGKTLVYASSTSAKLEPKLSIRAAWVGAEISKKAKASKIKPVVFDRGPRRYHGVVKVVAEAARQGGLEF